MRTRTHLALATTAVAALLTFPLTAAAAADDQADITVIEEAPLIQAEVGLPPATPADPVEQVAPELSDIPAPAAEPEPASAEPATPGPVAATVHTAAEPTEPSPAEASEPSPAAAVAAPADEPLDTTPPNFYAEVPAGNTVFRGDGSEFINFECYDVESGISDCQLLDHNGQAQAIGVPLELAVGHYTWTGVAVNSIGMRREVELAFVVDHVDATAPTIASDWVEPASGWSNREYVNFTATDGESGVKHISVKHNGVVRQLPGSFAGYNLVQGGQNLEFWAVDNAGNESPHETLFLNVDVVAPAIQTSPFGTSTADGTIEVVRGTDAAFSFTCSDVLSGVEACTSDIPGGELDIDTLGDHAYTVEAKDNAGNSASKRVEYTVVKAPTDPADVTAPVIVSDWNTAADVWANRAHVTFTATDDDSGVKYITIKNGATTKQYADESADFELAEGRQDLEFWAVDEAGNESQHQTVSMSVDLSEPTIHVSPFGSTTADGRIEVVQRAETVFSFTCSDALSGVEDCTSDIPDGELDIDTLGDHSHTVEAQDNAGNRASKRIEYTVVEAPVEPVDPVDPVDSVDPTDSAEPTNSNDSTGGSAGAGADAQGMPHLAMTGANVGWVAMIAAMLTLLAAGACAVHRRLQQGGSANLFSASSY